MQLTHLNLIRDNPDAAGPREQELTSLCCVLGVKVA